MGVYNMNDETVSYRNTIQQTQALKKQAENAAIELLRSHGFDARISESTSSLGRGHYCGQHEIPIVVVLYEKPPRTEQTEG